MSYDRICEECYYVCEECDCDAPPWMEEPYMVTARIDAEEALAV
jgi:hypothetical protein